MPPHLGPPLALASSPGLREVITSTRARTKHASFSVEKKAIIYACLERYQSLPETDLRAHDLTESATQELRKYRAQVGMWISAEARLEGWVRSHSLDHGGLTIR